MGIYHTDKNTKRMLLGRSGERSDKTGIRTKATQYKSRTQEVFSPSILFGTDIDAKPAPPDFTDGIEARFFFMSLLFYLVPRIKIFFHGG